MWIHDVLMGLSSLGGNKLIILIEYTENKSLPLLRSFYYLLSTEGFLKSTKLFLYFTISKAIIMKKVQKDN